MREEGLVRKTKLVQQFRSTVAGRVQGVLFKSINGGIFRAIGDIEKWFGQKLNGFGGCIISC